MNTTIRRRSGGALLTIAVALAAAPAPSSGWNPLDALVGAGRSVGSILGSPFGGAIEAATAPTIQSAEGSGHRLIADLDARLGAQVERVGGLTTSAIAGLDQAMEARVDQVDDKLSARILQLQGVGDELFGQARTTFSEIDADLQQRLAQVDGILARREEQLGRIVSTTVAQADRAIAARIDQADEVLAKRIGNVDVILTKQGLNLEGSLLKIGTLLAMVVLVAFIIWRLWVEIATKWDPALPTARRRIANAVSLSWPRILGQVAFAAAGALTLYVLSDRLTIGPRRDRASLGVLHVKGLEGAAKAFDLTRVHYHAAQLELLDDDPAAAQRHRALVLKSELLRDVFVRATILRNYDGVREVMQRVATLEQLLPAEPDVLVVKAHVLWQVGRTRASEIEAATIAADALATRTPPLGAFLLEPLARHYIALALRFGPMNAGESRLADSLRAARGNPGPERPFPAFEHVFAYDRLLDALDREATPAYVAMVEADAELHAAPDPTSRRKLLDARRSSAERVVSAWKRFDDELQSNGWLASSTAVLAAFELNDAMLSHARWFLARPETLELPPMLSRRPGTKPAAALPAELRARLAPLRVTLARRYAPMLGRNLGDVVAYEEARRFEDFERGTLAFEQAMRDWAAQGAGRPGPASFAAARAAALASARLGLHVPKDGRERPHAEVLLERAQLQPASAGAQPLPPDVAQALSVRMLRFL